MASCVVTAQQFLRHCIAGIDFELLLLTRPWKDVFSGRQEYLHFLHGNEQISTITTKAPCSNIVRLREGDAPQEMHRIQFLEKDITGIYELLRLSDSAWLHKKRTLAPGVHGESSTVWFGFLSFDVLLPLLQTRAPYNLREAPGTRQTLFARRPKDRGSIQSSRQGAFARLFPENIFLPGLRREKIISQRTLRGTRSRIHRKCFLRTSTSRNTKKPRRRIGGDMLPRRSPLPMRVQKHHFFRDSPQLLRETSFLAKTL